MPDLVPHPLPSPSRTPPKRTALILTSVVTLAAIAGAVAVFVAGSSSSRKASFRGDLLPAGIAMHPAPSFRLHDARGGFVSTAELAGKPYALTFLYTRCKDVCPLIGDELRQALIRLGPKAKRVNVVAISVDPRTDTPAVVQRWLRQHREPANFRYLIGSSRELRPVWSGYYVSPQPDDTEASQHSAAIWLIDARGRWRTRFSAGIPVNPADIAHDLRLLAD